MTRKARIIGETSALNKLERWGDNGCTLGNYLAEADGYDLPFTDPYGGKHTISLEPFAGQNPNLFFTLSVAVPDEGRDFNPIYSDAVVLKEYELPPGTQVD